MKYYSAVIFLSIAMTPVTSQAVTIQKSLGTSEVSIAGSLFNSVTEPALSVQDVRTVHLEQFDPSLGTLESVRIDLQANVGNFFNLRNNSSQTQDFNAVSEAVFSASWTGAEAPLQNTSVLEEVVEVAPYDPNEDAVVQFFGGEFGAEFFELTGSATTPFVGTGTLAVVMTLDLSGTVSTVEDVTFSILGKGVEGSGRGFVTYNYTEALDDVPPAVIPLPAGLPLLATALGLGALLRYRRR